MHMQCQRKWLYMNECRNIREICHGDAIQIRTGLILISPPRIISVRNITQTQNPPTSFLFDNDDDDDIDEDSHDSIDKDDDEGVENYVFHLMM